MSKKLLQAAAGAGGESVYVEDVFSTYLYTGNDTTQTVTTGLDIANEGGLIWQKPRVADTYNNDHKLFDTERGQNKVIYTNNNAVEDSGRPLSYTSTGFTLDTSSKFYGLNENNKDYVTWNFVKQAGFFDVVTYTGTGSNPHTVSHNLGSVPGFIVVKALSSTGNWCVAAYDGTNYKQLSLNSTNQSFASASVSNIATSTTIDVGYMGVNFDGSANASGVSYVAYLFAHDDQSFGDDSDESVIKCGSFSGTPGTEINLGWEPQWLMVKPATISGDWYIVDNMRGWPVGTSPATEQTISANSSSAEAGTNLADLTSTGFINNVGWTGQTIIYIAIRRPMKTPEAGTEVFATDTQYSTSPNPPKVHAGFPVDMVIDTNVAGGVDRAVYDRMRGAKKLSVNFPGTGVETSNPVAEFDFQDGYNSETGLSANTNVRSWMFKRAKGFFDIVCYTGTGATTQTQNHNLGVAPELIIVKERIGGGGTNWRTGLNFTSTDFEHTRINATNALTTQTYSASSYFKGQPSSTEFYVGANTDTGSNIYSSKYVAYLFATLAGVSKVGTYTGTGSNVNVDCGFTSGARFIFIRRGDSTANGYIYDSARGIVAGNDPYIILNNTVAETTGTDYIDPLSSGFTVTSSAPAELNASGGTYFFLAIA